MDILIKVIGIIGSIFATYKDLDTVVGDSPKGEHHIEITHYSIGFNGIGTTIILKPKGTREILYLPLL